ncbi:MAG: Stp1/IreP family PP2C-type Ser/Thr phosphatase [Deferribacteres bacterium]|nr:Stp1/IreP family PP2C-type Ser/Thr phosphatase [candidate division KSB1 bacterium]MCB9501437.1 Stp1/IreP family PP2C-type Ser/Thr phosphatase [Deferribacteres bacterium]
MKEAVAHDVVFMAAATDTGTVRKNNEDAYFFSKKEQLFVLCDGMGGHESGEVASKLAVETVQNVFTQKSNFQIEAACADLPENLPAEAKILVSAVRYANRRILHHALNSPEKRGMGTTIVAAYYKEGMIYTVHVGDSRIYRLRNGKLIQLTSDHSWLNELLEDKEITENDLKHFNEKNVLTRALGTYPTVKIDVYTENVQEEDLYLFCSDGLHNALNDNNIRQLLNSSAHSSLQDAVTSLIERAKEQDGSDNITAGLLYFPTLLHQKPQYRQRTTVSDESESISQVLDKTLKSSYSLPAVKSGNIKKWSLAAAAAVLLTTAVIFPNWKENPVKNTNAGIPSALFNENLHRATNSKDHINTADLKDAGSVVLVQIRDRKYLDVLRSLEYIKILDAPDQFKKDIPIHAGTFTWAIADESDYILYKNNNIKLTAIDDWASHRGNTSSFGTNSGNESGTATYTNVPENRGLIYLVGSFPNTTYKDSQIYINDQIVGKLSNFLNDGFTLRPGEYTLTIRTNAGRVQHIKRNINVVDGQILTVEF